MVIVRWTEDALRNVRDIAQYISQDSQEAADQLISEFFKKTALLEDHPKMGRIVPEKAIPNLRELLHKRYRIIYEIFNTDLRIILVLHQSWILRV
jgi:toxin ParE1/3/4